MNTTELAKHKSGHAGGAAIGRALVADALVGVRRLYGRKRLSMLATRAALLSPAALGPRAPCGHLRVDPDTFEYRKGATCVDSDVADLLEAGAGVCQDFVQLALRLERTDPASIARA